MSPALNDGELLFVDHLAYKAYTPQRGDLVVLQRDARRSYVKRVLGLPGETIEIRRGQVFANGQLVPESYIKNPGTGSMPSRELGPDEYFVLGDNRDNSSDSRHWGPVSLGAIEGKAWFIYWPPGRIGLISTAQYK